MSILTPAKQAMYGGPDFESWSSVSWSAREDMTAISMLYTLERFFIAADGRCRSDNPEKEKDQELVFIMTVQPTE